MVTDKLLVGNTKYKPLSVREIPLDNNFKDCYGQCQVPVQFCKLYAVWVLLLSVQNNFFTFDCKFLFFVFCRDI